MDTQNVIAQAEATIRLARLSEALKLAETCVVRKPEGGSPLSNLREVVLVVANDTAADALVDAIRNACK